ncbi:MAG: hypothetical protein WCT07_00605 [Candidatus Paceibacterota bacterium]|jgi:hypothetical protein
MKNAAVIESSNTDDSMLSLLARLVLACVNDAKEMNCRPTIFDIHKKILEESKGDPFFTLDEVVDEVNKLHHAGRLFFEHGSNGWDTEKPSFKG